MKRAASRRFFASVPLIAVLIFSGCVSATKMLERAETAWAAGQYAAAIENALQSYEKAVGKDGDPEEIAAARSFLEDKFPQANANLDAAAQRQLNGSDAEKTNAWKIYRSLVDLNRRVNDSAASGFLETEDFTEDLRMAKETAAEVLYSSALTLMEENERSAYIEAWGLFQEIDSLVSGFRDIGDLADECVEKGTYIVALSDREVTFTVVEGDADPEEDIAETVWDIAEKYIENHDHPMFVEFITADSAASAAEADAGLFLEIQGEIRISSEIDNDYNDDGTVTWSRAISGSPIVIVTRLSDTRIETGTAGFDLEQEISVEFYIQKYETRYLDAETYDAKFNNAGWMKSQLSEAENAMDDNAGEAVMEVFAEFGYGGIPDFTRPAQIDDAENGGLKDVVIDSSVWKETADFIRYSLPDFETFEDMDPANLIAGEIWEAALENDGARDLLENLED